MRRRTAFDRLQHARAQLDRAYETGADPWRIAELQLRHDEALALAMAEPDAVDDGDTPRARTTADPVPYEFDRRRLAGRE